MKNGVYIDKSGNKRYYNNDVLHREHGPAIEDANGDQFWHLNGWRHRVNGPAAEYANGDKEWWLNGIKMSEIQHALAAVENKKMGVYVDRSGTIRYYKKDLLDRKYGPAVEFANGDKEWWLNGIRMSEKEHNVAK